MIPKPKTPMPRQERGRIGAARRWGPKRRLNIGDLTPAQREVVLGLIEAQRLANSTRPERDAA